MSLNIVFAGTPHFAEEVLKALLESPHHLLGVLTQPDRPKGRGQKMIASPVKALALQHHLPVFQPITLKDPTTQKILADLNPDVIVVVAYGLILPSAVLSIPKYGCINVHASLLPRWRGAAPINRALLAGDEVTGITIMQMDKGLDTGDMLYTKSCPIEKKDTGQTLHDRLALLGASTLVEALSLIESSTLMPEKQDESKACYADKILKSDGKILWNTETASEIERKMRALNPWPIAFFEREDLNNSHSQELTVRVFDAEVIKNISIENAAKPAKPGTILQVSPQGIDVATKQGILRLLQIQLPGRKPLFIKDILNAHPHLFKAGEILN